MSCIAFPPYRRLRHRPRRATHPQPAAAGRSYGLSQGNTRNGLVRVAAVRDTSGTDSRLGRVRLIVARCEVTYTGRVNAFLPESTRLLMLKGDGSVLVHADAGGYKPLNWMTPPTVIDDSGDVVVVRKRAGRSEDRLEIRLLEVLSDFEHEMGEAAGLEKDGVERDLQLLLADDPTHILEGLRLVQREWPTDVGPVDLMCRDEDDGWVAVEIKRVGTIDAVEQLTRYLDCIRV